MVHRIAGIDVHKKMLAVVVADVASEGAYQFERRKFATTPEQLRGLAAWLAEQQVEEGGNGIDGAILEAGVGDAGTILAAATAADGRLWADEGEAASGASQVEPRARWAEEWLR